MSRNIFVLFFIHVTIRYYLEIATYLGFSSQSHMGMEFKRIVGMTPGEYRAKYVREDFMNDSM